MAELPFRNFTPQLGTVNALRANGLVVAAGVHEGRPVLIFQFAYAGKPHAPVMLDLPPGDDLDGVTRLVEAAVAAGKAATATSTAKPVPVVTCPGCGAELHGDIAVRGACLVCYPDLPKAL